MLNIFPLSTLIVYVPTWYKVKIRKKAVGDAIYDLKRSATTGNNLKSAKRHLPLLIGCLEKATDSCINTATAMRGPKHLQTMHAKCRSLRSFNTKLLTK